MSWTLDQILKATNGKEISKKQINFVGIGTDTRKDLAHKIFIALKGDQFDAHDFLSQATAQKAAAIIIDRPEKVTDLLKSQTTIILVKDTLKALQDLGHFHRTMFQGKVIGITGSNGKTSTKEFMATIISEKLNVFYSKGSFNNHWGVPMSLLDIKKNHDVALIEMGMNHAGEITELVKIANPNIVICTMVGSAHIEHFGSVESIAKAKEEIYIAAQKKAVQIYNLDNPLTLKMFEKAKNLYPDSMIITFSDSDSNSDVCLQVTSMTLNSITLKGQIRGVQSGVEVPVFGLQNKVNLMAAAAGALACGLTPDEIWKGLKKCKTVWGRNQLLQTPSKAQIIFDGYNANPESMKVLLENVQNLKADHRKIGVFGQMLEMGEASEKFHAELGEQVGSAGFAEVFFYGKDFELFTAGVLKTNPQVQVHAQLDFTDSLALQLAALVKSNDLVVVKGSRGMRLERMILQLNPIGFNEKK